MAQLIKLEDHISRYEWDMYRYPTQFIRMKQEHWYKLQKQYEEAIEAKILYDKMKHFVGEPELEESVGFFRRTFFKKSKDDLEKEVVDEPAYDSKLANLEEVGLRHYFLDQLFPLQFKWATSTVSKVSFVSSNAVRDQDLQYLLRRFPDTFLIMYRPVFNVKNTSIESETIFISPIGIEIIHFIEEPSDATIVAGNDRTWSVELKDNSHSILNPIIAVKRTEQIIRSILKTKGITFPIKKTILSRVNSFTYVTEPYQVQLIDKNEYTDWLEEQRVLQSPLKADQLKVAELLLKYTETNAIRRPEWEEETTLFTEDEFDNEI